MKKSKFSKVGYVLAILGSAVGLGNIWKFPYITGENGGGVFVLVFLLSVFTIGISIFVGEIILGKIAKKDPVTTFEVLAPNGNKAYKYIGFTFITAILILSFYPIVIAWIFHYIVLSINSLPSTLKASETAFVSHIKDDIFLQIFYYTLAFIWISYTISKGVKDGIEKLNNFLMPTLFLLLLFMLFYSFTMEGFSKAFYFMFNLDFEKFNTNSILIAVGHAFFCLSIGVTVIISYSASISDKTNIAKAALSVVIMDVLTAILSGLIIFTIIFTAASEPNKGAGLVFITLPSIFYDMGTFGVVLALVFFISLAFASITSAVSMLEPAVMYLIDRKGFSRLKATIVWSLASYSLGIVVILSNTNDYSTYLTFANKNLFDWLDFLTSAILMPLAGIFVSLFVGFVLDKDKSRNALVPYFGIRIYNIWLFIIRYIAPISIFILMLKEIGILKF